MSRLDELLVMAAVDTDECVIWPYAKNSKGYGVVWDGSRQWKTHALICTAWHGPRPERLETAHSCGVRPCVNPRHLRWATSAENSADTRERGRFIHTLTVDDVIEIRRLAGDVSQNEIARRFGVSQRTVWRVIHRKKWRWVA